MIVGCITKEAIVMKNKKGFSLIELMVVVAVLGILSAISFPAYTDYILRTQITEGTSALSGLQVKMEQYYQDNRTYIGACSDDSIAPIPKNLKYFNIYCEITSSGDGFLLTASGKDGKFIFQVDEANNMATQSVPINWVNTSDCWVGKKNGECLK